MRRRARAEVADHELSTMSPAQLLEACRSGDAEAWERLVDRYHNLVFAIALGEGLSTEDAADLTQSTFEALLAQLDKIRDDSSIASWLMTVARRQAWRARDRKKRFALMPDESSATPVQLTAADASDDVVKAMWVYEGLSMLDDPCRRLLTALYFDPTSPSYAEVAAELCRPVGSIGPCRARCLARLRVILGEACFV